MSMIFQSIMIVLMLLIYWIFKNIECLKINDSIIIILDKCNGSYDVVYDLSTKLCVPSKTKDVTKINEAKALVKHISSDSKCKFNISTCNSNQKWNNDEYQCDCKRYLTCGTCIAHVFLRIVSI